MLYDIIIIIMIIIQRDFVIHLSSVIHHQLRTFILGMVSRRDRIGINTERAQGDLHIHIADQAIDTHSICKLPASSPPHTVRSPSWLARAHNPRETA